MTQFEQIERLFSELIRESEGTLSDSERGEIQRFLDVGEYGLALETAVEIFVEEKKKPPASVMLRLEQLAAAMSYDTNQFLARLV